ncbi:hypothetical protein PDE_04708 [Penicillium oxalicum 114-2]|uniref:Uncharacterized protein n=1 Tax=Penicillium oxalicum (strain 114-2 / CGMCC 5302) TaxID=933388 RepID=S8AUE4_PENO1|nr:hypothetical protein PDE_04708 [Penicillium oxalicum 114-2]
MKFNVPFGLATAIILAPAALAQDPFEVPHGAIPTYTPPASATTSSSTIGGTQPSSIYPSTTPSIAVTGGGFGHGRYTSSSAYPSMSAHPSGGFGHHGHHGHHGYGGFPPGGFGGFGPGGHGGRGGHANAPPSARSVGTVETLGRGGYNSAPSEIAEDLFVGSDAQKPGDSAESTEQFKRLHARQVRPFQA